MGREGGNLRGVLRMNEGERGKRLERAGELPNAGKKSPSQTPSESRKYVEFWKKILIWQV